MGKQHTKQRREQSQEFIVICQSSMGLQAAENLTNKPLQLQEADGESRQFLFEMLRVKIFKNCWYRQHTFPRSCKVNLGCSLVCWQNMVRDGVKEVRASLTVLARVRLVKRTDRIETRAKPVASEEASEPSR